MACRQHDRVVGLTRGRRDAGQCRRGKARRHAGDHAEADAGGAEGYCFVPATAEYERIAALQTEHPTTTPRPCDQHLVDFVLMRRRLPTTFASGDQLSILVLQAQHTRIDQRVMHDVIGCRDRMQREQGQQPGITRTCAGEPDFARRERGHRWEAGKTHARPRKRR